MSEKPRTGNEPWNEPWFVDELDRLDACPVCACTERTVLHADLIDNVFYAAAGKWTLHGCSSCGVAYLDPRPNQASIHRAYFNYYTHQLPEGKDRYVSLSPMRKLRRRLANGYTNWRYASNAQPASRLGVLTAWLLPRMKKVLDRQYRHMPRLPQGGGRLLDVGCGDGTFLALARTCGWDVVGLDPDPEAVSNAKKQGLSAYEGGVEYFSGKTDLFDVITLNHVIEHVYEPVKVLESCYTLLKPGGRLWLETPNIDSFGSARFHKNWRGLETPRHLVLFNRRSLEHVVVVAGFSAPKICSRPSACMDIFRVSYAMEQCMSEDRAKGPPQTLKLLITATTFLESVWPSRKEFLTISARKAAK